jgi:hypothetical protein
LEVVFRSTMMLQLVHVYITAVRLRTRCILESVDLAEACGRKWVVSI